MTEPTPQPADGPSWIGRLIDTLNNYRPVVKDLAIALGVFATLATSFYNSCQSNRHGEKLQTIENKTDSAAVKADVAAVKSEDAVKRVEQVQTTALQTQVVAAKTLATETGKEEKQPELVAAKDALAEHKAATQAANQAAPTK